ncbi:hypothetical protein Mgra_00000161 [Meloidogyne graminicola]|uniref:Uncharacterized protein n=1 Tax=Meloidogyne graminicola TaxID=189291 RepID=A0A8T0A485_9BILA|nr:hypothetical protein Mgra_00000161 [Meloidogyne graminicola]
MSLRLQKSSTLCSSQLSSTTNTSNNNSSQLKPLLMSRNSSIGENVPPNVSSSENRSQQQNHLAPPAIAPESPRPQKIEQSPLASVGLTIPLPNTTSANNTNKK